MQPTSNAHSGVLSATDRLRARGPAEVLQAVPFLLGFRPELSIVLLGLRAPKGSVRLTARLDLGAPIAAAEPWFTAARKEKANRLLLVVYDDSIVGRPLAHRQLVDSLTDRGAQIGFHLVDALAASTSRWWSYSCNDASCCPDEGQAIPDEGAVAASAVSCGLVAAPSRTALVDELTTDPVREAAICDFLDRMSPAEIENVFVGPSDAAATKHQVTTFADVEAVIVKQQRSGAPWRAQEAVRVLLALQDVGIRDAVIALLPSCADDDAISCWRDLCVCSPEPLVAPAATLLAICTYAAGDGARTNVAIERALTTRPAYRMAQLLDSAVSGGLAPHLFVPNLINGAQRERARLAPRDMV